MGGGDLTEEEMKVIIKEYFKRAYKTTTRHSATLLPVLGDGMNCYKLLYKAMCKYQDYQENVGIYHSL